MAQDEKLGILGGFDRIANLTVSAATVLRVATCNGSNESAICFSNRHMPKQAGNVAVKAKDWIELFNRINQNFQRTRTFLAHSDEKSLQYCKRHSLGEPVRPNELEVKIGRTTPLSSPSPVT